MAIWEFNRLRRYKETEDPRDGGFTTPSPHYRYEGCDIRTNNDTEFSLFSGNFFFHDHVASWNRWTWKMVKRRNRRKIRVHEDSTKCDEWDLHFLENRSDTRVSFEHLAHFWRRCGHCITVAFSIDKWREDGYGGEEKRFTEMRRTSFSKPCGTAKCSCTWKSNFALSQRAGLWRQQCGHGQHRSPRRDHQALR